MEWNDYLARGDTQGVAATLDALDHDGRVRAANTLPRGSFKQLFDITQGARPLTLEDLVPAGVPPLTTVHHLGINSLPAFRAFEKAMFRTGDGSVSGRNVQPWSWATGPGYFSARRRDNVLQLDYTALPTSKPAEWPAIASNARGLSYFVFRNLIDDLHPVSKHITIGSATRLGNPLGQYFLLVRKP